MRILHVVPTMKRAGGGPSESVPMTAMAQLAACAQVGIAFLDEGERSLMVGRAEAAGVVLHAFKGGQPWYNRIGFSIDLLLNLRRIASVYDVLVIHANWLFPVWWAAHVARKLGKPYYMMPRGSFAPERLRISAWKKKLVGWLDRHYARHAAAVWATAESEAEGVRKYVPGVRTAVFPIGLDWEKYKVERKGGGGQRTLLFFSRISPIKGLDLLAEAWGRIQSNNQTNPNQTIWKLLIAGPDDRGYTEEIKKVFAAKCPAGSYEFRGPAYGEEKLRLLASADAFVLPTRNENWGNAVAEAMASGLPVVCTKGAPWECLETERAGRWVDISAEGIQKGIEDILALSDEERQAMGERGRKWVRENLDWTAIAKKMIKCLEV